MQRKWGVKGIDNVGSVIEPQNSCWIEKERVPGENLWLEDKGEHDVMKAEGQGTEEAVWGECRTQGVVLRRGGRSLMKGSITEVKETKWCDELSRQILKPFWFRYPPLRRRRNP